MTKAKKTTKSGHQIVPAKLVGVKRRKSKGKPLVGTPGCGCAPDSLVDGIVVNWDGNLLIASPPTTGGPWILAMYPNGQWVWINGAGF